MRQGQEAEFNKGTTRSCLLTGHYARDIAKKMLKKNMCVPTVANRALSRPAQLSGMPGVLTAHVPKGRLKLPIGPRSNLLYAPVTKVIKT